MAKKITRKTNKNGKPIKQEHLDPLEKKRKEDEEERKKEQEALQLLNKKAQERQEEYLRRLEALNREFGVRLEPQWRIVPIPIRGGM